MDDVLRLRSLYEPVRLRFPIEITVAGSSGLGWFSTGQRKADLLRHVGEVARGFAPFTFRFERVARFPDTSVYYLSPRNDARFHDFQRRLADCGLRFEPAPFSYVPHCTIAILPPGAVDSAHAEIMACPVPDGQIRVSSISFYSVDISNQQCYQEERVALDG
ncbi:MAG: 2'-5' RNA ligase family protein [Pseudomonadota bacterium]